MIQRRESAETQRISILHGCIVRSRSVNWAVALIATNNRLVQVYLRRKRFSKRLIAFGESIFKSVMLVVLYMYKMVRGAAGME